MTTIAYRDGILASDSDAGRGDYRCAGSTQKLFRTREGVCGVTGGIARAMAIVRWLGADEPQGECPIATDEFTVIHVKRGGTVDLHEDGGVHHPQFEFMAWGSGMAAALGALYAGADARQAVAIAAKIDPHTGGKVVSMKVAK